MSDKKKTPPKNGPLWAQSVSTVLGLGYVPKMPGTIGAAAGIFLYLPAFLLSERGAFIFVLTELVIILVLAAIATPIVLRASGQTDPSFVVIDEVAGMLSALAFLSPDFLYLMLAFVFFRLLDILKPYPVNRFEELPGTWGVMADDIVAGILAGMLSILVLRIA